MTNPFKKYADLTSQTVCRVGVSVQNNLRFRKRVLSAPDYNLSEQNVLFLVVDCLRGDHLSPYYDRNTTPFLGHLNGVNTTAVSAAPWTFSSVPSILSGLYPHNHGAVYEDIVRNLKEGHPPQSIRNAVYTLPELLAASGYKTYLLTAIDLVELPFRGRFSSRSVRHNVSAADLVEELMAWWERHEDRPRFAYVHFGDLHEPLRNPDSCPFGEIPDIEGLDRWRFTRSTEPADEFEQYRRERIRLYDTILRSLDHELERLFSRLEARTELEETIVVITGDHGEEFWERRTLESEHFHDPRGVYGVGHGHALIPEVLEVPLIIPRWNTETTSHVSTTDIVPTVLSELGVPHNHLKRFDGFPLTELPSDRALLAEEIAYGFDQQAIIKGDYYLINSPYENETIVLDRYRNEIVGKVGITKSLLEYIPDERRSGSAISVDAETKKRLSDLGYL